MGLNSSCQQANSIFGGTIYSNITVAGCVCFMCGKLSSLLVERSSLLEAVSIIESEKMLSALLLPCKVRKWQCAFWDNKIGAAHNNVIVHCISSDRENTQARCVV